MILVFLIVYQVRTKIFFHQMNVFLLVPWQSFQRTRRRASQNRNLIFSSCVRISGVPESVGENTADIVCDIAKKLNVNLVSNDISVSHRLPSAKGHKQIIARFTHAQKRSELLKATKNIPKIPDLSSNN
jgi:hypothetical protein